MLMVAIGDEPAEEVDRLAKPTAPAPSLSYDRAGAGTVSVRGFRLLVALTLVNTVLLASMVLGPQLFPFARQQVQAWKDARAEKRRIAAEIAAQTLCRNHSDPATRVVYEEDPEGAVKLLNADPKAYEPAQQGRPDAPPGWVAPVHAAPPDHYGQYVQAVAGRAISNRYNTLLFLHERTSSGGEKRLVAVRLSASSRFFQRSEQDAELAEVLAFRQEKARMLIADCWPVGAGATSAGGRARVQSIQLRLSLPDEATRVVARVKPGAPLESLPAIEYGNRLRVYAGQADPNDPSHFTIAYDLDGRAGTIDGWLRDEGPAPPAGGRVGLLPEPGRGVEVSNDGTERRPLNVSPQNTFGRPRGARNQLQG